jgi:ribonucleoside-diphosphate reductase alpha chain
MNAGIGILGLATVLARKNLRFDSIEGMAEIHRVCERHMYYAIKCSIQLGKELGNAPWINRTKWVDGWLPIDTYNKSVDEICNTPLQYDWEALRKALIANKGMRFSSLVAHMPTESSSKAAGCPNGVYPIRELSIGKSDATNTIDWTAPDSDLIGHQYQLAYDHDLSFICFHESSFLNQSAKDTFPTVLLFFSPSALYCCCR